VAVVPEHNRLAIDHKLLSPIPEHSLRDPREAIGPIITATGDQPDAVAIALDAQTISVVFDFVESLGAGGHNLADDRNAELELGFWHTG
jgi:hypothetical protein